MAQGRAGALRYGQDCDGQVVPAVKLGQADIVRDYGPDILAKLPGAHSGGGADAVFAEDGMHPDAVASLYGYPNGEALLLALATIADIEIAADRLADQHMAERYGDPMLDGGMRRAALDALHNEKAIAFLSFELATVQELAGSQPHLTPETAHARIDGLMSKMTVQHAADIESFVKAAGKAGRQAARLMATAPRTSASDETDSAAADPIEEIAVAKHQQLIEHMLYLQAVAAIDTLTSLRALVPEPQTPEAVHITAARAIAAHFGIVESQDDFDFGLWIEDLLSSDPMTAEVMKTPIALMRGKPPALDAFSVKTLEAIEEAISTVLSAADPMRRVGYGSTMRPRQEVVAELMVGLSDAAISTTPFAYPLAAVPVLSADAAFARLQKAIAGMDPKHATALTAIVIDPVENARQHYLTARQEVLPALENLLAGQGGGQAISAPELGYMFADKAELLHAILHAGTEEGLEKLLLGHRWAGRINDMPGAGNVFADRWDLMIKRLIDDGVLTVGDFNLVQKIWDLCAPMEDPAQKAFLRLYGRRYKTARRRDIKTPFGLYSGGFVPAISTQADLSSDIVGQDIFMLPARRTQPRQRLQGGPLVLNLAQLAWHIERMLRFSSLYPALREAMGMMLDSDVYSAIAALDARLVSDLILSYLRCASASDFEQKAAFGNTGIPAFYKKLRRNPGLNRIFKDLVCGAGDAAARVISRLDASRLEMALLRLMSDDQASAMRAEAETASLFMRKHFSASEKGVAACARNAMAEPKKLNGDDGCADRHAQFFFSAIDNLLALVAWHAAYDSAVAEGQENASAIAAADAAVQALPALETKVGRQNVIRHFAWLFAGFENQMRMQSLDPRHLMSRHDWNGAPEAFFVYLYAMAAPGYIAQMIATMLDSNAASARSLSAAFFNLEPGVAAMTLPDCGALNPQMLRRFCMLFHDGVNTAPVQL